MKNKAPKKKISRKQKGFVKDYIETGNATEAAARNYKVKNRKVAQSIGTENLSKPVIQEEVKSIAKEIPNSLLLEKHMTLLHAKEVQRFIFPTRLKNPEIEDMVREAGFKVITIRPSPLGKMAFYSIDNSRAIKDGLDMAYKIKGTYSPEEFNLKFNSYSKDQLVDLIVSKLGKKK